MVIMAVFFTSDLHFSHDRDFIYKPRGFNSIEEHDAEIIKRWNDIVKKEDIVYVLGDLIMGDQDAAIENLKKLNGKIRFLAGNHDTNNKIIRYLEECNFTYFGCAAIIKHGKKTLYISHYPTITGNTTKEKVINLHGHTHSKNKFTEGFPLMYNVALDAHNCRPVSIEQIIKDIREHLDELKEE